MKKIFCGASPCAITLFCPAPLSLPCFSLVPREVQRETLGVWVSGLHSVQKEEGFYHF